MVVGGVDAPLSPFRSMAAAFASRSLVATGAAFGRRASTPFRRLLTFLASAVPVVAFFNSNSNSIAMPAKKTSPAKTHPRKKTSPRKASPAQTARARAATRSLLERLQHPDAAGIDIAAEELVAAVPAERAAQPVRTFATFTPDLHALRDWLLACGIKTVALESTGNYWIATYQILEEAGLEVFLVNARHVKAVPGKKTDVCDAQWLQQLHAAGLLAKSFRPASEIVALRYLLRHRSHLLESASRELQLMQKVCTEMNLHLHHVFSDLDGISAQSLMSAILAGERDPEKLLSLCHRNCRAPRAKILAALQGDYRPEYLFVLGQCQARWQEAHAAMAALDAQLASCLAQLSTPWEGSAPAAPCAQRRLHKNSPRLPIYDEAWRFYGVDLSAIEGVSAGTLANLMGELGNGLQIQKAFPSARAFCSWLGLCPDNRVSGGKILKAKTRPVRNRVATALRLAAQALSHSKSQLGDYCRRLKGRLGKAEGITATAHKLARIIYAMITTRKPYDPAQAFQLTPAKRQRRLRQLQTHAARLGFTLVPQPS
jgi:transposase